MAATAVQGVGRALDLAKSSQTVATLLPARHHGLGDPEEANRACRFSGRFARTPLRATFPAQSALSFGTMSWIFLRPSMMRSRPNSNALTSRCGPSVKCWWPCSWRYGYVSMGIHPRERRGHVRDLRGVVGVTGLPELGADHVGHRLRQAYLWPSPSSSAHASRDSAARSGVVDHLTGPGQKQKVSLTRLRVGCGNRTAGLLAKGR